MLTHLPSRDFNEYKNPSPEEILEIRIINGLHYKQIEKVLRTPPFNYLAPEEDLRITIATQTAFINELSLTHQAIFQTIVNIYKSSKSGNNVTIMLGQIPLSVAFAETAHMGMKTPFNDTASFVYDLTLTNKKTNISTSVPAVLPALIDRYGFYGSLNYSSPQLIHALPELPIILGMTSGSLESCQKLYKAQTEKYAQLAVKENELRRQIVPGSSILKAFEKSGLSYPPFRSLSEWYAAIEDHIMLYAGKMDYQQEYSAFRSAHEELDNLSAQGIDFADMYTLYCTELFHRLPGE